MPDFGIFRGFNDKLFGNKLYAGQLPTQLGTIGSVIIPIALLDLYPNAAAAYSLRKLRSAYSGFAIRVRRSSDNTEQDIGFNSLGGLDTSSLTSFCGSGNGFVTTWYDQSGNGYNATQTTAANQPQIVSSGSVINVNSKPSIAYNGSTTQMINSNLSLSQPSTHILVMKDDASVDAHIVDRYTGSGNRQVDYLPGGVFSIFAGTALSSGVSVGTAQRLFFNIFNSTTSNIRHNGASVATGNAGTQSLAGLNIGSNSGFGQNYNGKLQELILYNSNQSSNNTGIESNINSYYGIY
jgi:hypothetical protein